MSLDSQRIKTGPQVQHTATPPVPRVPVPKGIKDLLAGAIAEYSTPVEINFWDMEYVPGRTSEQSLTLYFRHPGVLRNLILHRDRIFLTECWLNHLFEFDGSVPEMIRFAEHLSMVNYPPALALQAYSEALRLPRLSLSSVLKHGRLHRGGSTAEDIQHHYDVGNEFYELFLDPLMVYSCAHFEDENMSLSQAQEAKLDLICRKLRLQPGERLLDVGCGWGALLRWAAKNYGITGYGITLSPSQLSYAKEKAAEERLSARLHFELMDYRELPEGLQFDKIVSVGMIEHVGLKNYPTYFSCLLNALAPGGLFLCHGITTADSTNQSGFNGKFINRFIFPGGELANLPQLLEHARAAGWETIDVDNWRPHYAETLIQWAHNLEANIDRAVEIGGERISKLWLLYLYGSANGFKYNWLRIYQSLLRKSQDSEWNVPMVRRNWLV